MGFFSDSLVIRTDNASCTIVLHHLSNNIVVNFLSYGDKDIIVS